MSTYVEDYTKEIAGLEAKLAEIDPTTTNEYILAAKVQIEADIATRKRWLADEELKTAKYAEEARKRRDAVAASVAKGLSTMNVIKSALNAAGFDTAVKSGCTGENRYGDNLTDGAVIQVENLGDVRLVESYWVRGSGWSYHTVYEPEIQVTGDPWGFKYPFSSRYNGRYNVVDDKGWRNPRKFRSLKNPGATAKKIVAVFEELKAMRAYAIKTLAYHDDQVAKCRRVGEMLFPKLEILNDGYGKDLRPRWSVRRTVESEGKKIDMASGMWIKSVDSTIGI